MPSAFAVTMLVARSNLVGCSTGISPGFAPRRILSTNSAVRRTGPSSGTLTPTTNGRRHSILRLACRTTFDHLSVSARMCAASSSGVLKVGSNPMVAIRSLMSGSAMIFAI